MLRRIVEAHLLLAHTWVFWVYVAFVVLGAWWLLRPAARQQRLSQPRRARLFAAAYVALAFTPSMVGDFWLFSAPGPALLGFLLFLPVIVVNMIPRPHETLPYLYMTVVLYVLPITAVFALMYGILALRARRRSASANESI